MGATGESTATGARQIEALRQRVAELEEAEARCRNLQLQVRESEAMLRSIVANIPDVVYRLDARGYITFISETVSRHGYDPKELVGTHILDWVHPEDRERAVYKVNERRTGERRVRSLELRLFPSSSRSALFEVRTTQVVGPTFLVAAEGLYQSDRPRSETFVGTQGIARDITASKQVEEELRLQTAELARSNALLQEKDGLLAAFHRIGQAVLSSLELEQVLDALAEQIVSSSILRSLMIALVDDERRSVRVVRSYRSESGEQGAVVVRDERSCGTTYALEDDNITAEVARTGKMQVIEGWDPRFDEYAGDPDRRQGQVAYFLPVCKEEQVLAVLATGSQIAEKEEVLRRLEAMQPLVDQVAVALEHARLYRRLCDSEERMVQSQKMEAIGQLAAGITHNFNNMLMVINGNLKLALGEAPEELREQLEVAAQAGERAAEVVKQLQLFSRKSDSAMKAVDLYRVVQSVVEICRRIFDRRLEIAVESGANVPLGWADAVQIEQVVLNLCLNARDALSEIDDASRRLRIRLRVYRVEVRQDDAHHPKGKPGLYACIEVEDNGTGMDEETQQRIFEPFFTTKEPGRGTGLGLATVYGIMQQHSGWIECRSALGEGTTFSVFLPAALEVEEEQVVRQEHFPRGSETILVVEDEVEVRHLMRRILERSGFAVLEAVDGRQGMEVFEREEARIDLVILDLSMPHMSGQQMLATLRQRQARARLVVCTGYVADLSECAGAHALIRKPFQPEELARGVRRVLDAR